MFEKPEILRTAHALAAHAGARQALVAENVANADTPGYRARDLADFAEVFRTAGESTMRTTRPGHLGGSAMTDPAAVVETAAALSPNGNAVSLEAEMVKAADLRQQHDLALSVYRAGSDILRASLGRIR